MSRPLTSERSRSASDRGDRTTTAHSDQTTTGGVMRSTSRAAEGERPSTRDRANVLRSATNGELEAARTDDPGLRRPEEPPHPIETVSEALSAHLDR